MTPNPTPNDAAGARLRAREAASQAAGELLEHRGLAALFAGLPPPLWDELIRTVCETYGEKLVELVRRPDHVPF